MRAETERLTEEIEKSLELLRQRVGWDTAEHRLEELNAMSEDPASGPTPPAPRSSCATARPSPTRWTA